MPSGGESGGGGERLEEKAPKGQAGMKRRKGKINTGAKGTFTGQNFSYLIYTSACR